MNTETPREFEQIHWLYHEFRDAISRGGISRQTALDALEYALEELLSDVCDSEEKRQTVLRDHARSRYSNLATANRFGGIAPNSVGPSR